MVQSAQFGTTRRHLLATMPLALAALTLPSSHSTLRETPQQLALRYPEPVELPPVEADCFVTTRPMTADEVRRYKKAGGRVAGHDGTYRLMEVFKKEGINHPLWTAVV